jgi:DNA modification methylase
MENNYEIYQGNALDLFKSIKDESIDCIVTDPPYETISGGAQDNPYV